MWNQSNANKLDLERIKIHEDNIEIEDENIVIFLGSDQSQITNLIYSLTNNFNMIPSQINKNIITRINPCMFILNYPMIDNYDLPQKITEWNNLKSFIEGRKIMFTLLLDENQLLQPTVQLSQYLHKQYISLENSITNVLLLLETKSLSIIISDLRNQMLTSNLTKPTRQDVLLLRESIFNIYWSCQSEEKTIRGYRSFLYYLSEAFSENDSYFSLRLEIQSHLNGSLIKKLLVQEKVDESEITIKAPKEVEEKILDNQKQALINLPQEQFNQLPVLFSQLAQKINKDSMQQVYNIRVSQFNNKIQNMLKMLNSNNKLPPQEYLSLLNEMQAVQLFEQSLSNFLFEKKINIQDYILQIKDMLLSNLVSLNPELGFQNSLEVLRKFSEWNEQFQKLEDELNELINYKKQLQSPLLGSSKYRKEGQLEIYLYPRYTEKDFNQIEKENIKVILVVGQTGSGKSTMLDAMANYLSGVEFDYPFRYKLVDEKSNNSAESVTQEVKQYYIKSRNTNFCPILVVDTPGFMDTSGIQRDKQTTDQIETYFKQISDQIHCVCLVSPSSTARLTASQKYVFDKVLQIFGRDIEENIVNLFTFCDGGRPQVLHAITSDKIPDKHWYKFNNSALFAKSSNSEKDDNFEQMYWQMGVKSMHNFFQDLNDKFSPRSLKLTKDVLNERKKLEHTVINIRPRIDTCLSKLEETRRLLELLEHHREEIKRNENFRYTEKVERFKKIELAPGINTTTCRDCNRTCHNNCAFKDDSQKSKCRSILNEYCTACPKKCHWSSHSNIPYKFDYYIELEEKTSEDLRKKFVNAQNSESDANQMINRLSEEFLLIRQQIYNDISTLQQTLTRLGDIALRPHPYSPFDVLDQMIQNEEHNKKSGYLQRRSSLLEVKKQYELLNRLTAQQREKVLQDIFKDYTQTVEKLKKEKKVSLCTIF